ncbi:hypothetical protein CN514_10545 [Bacillus sp. AFS001701]|uniref:hypothetical protein n=2 Tax=Bacillaceae TaxID=186817 RepID=UPI000BF9DA71|nr:hypothetical protein [Bacillus sp. AFS001701]PET67331.1 hypothetical protein CN514_10545 [Bacillus sp. AFS001701]
MNNKKTNSEQKLTQSSDISDLNKENIMKLANNLKGNETTIDMSSIMRMAQNLFKDDSLMKSVQDLGKTNQSKSISFPKSAQKEKNLELPLTGELLEKISNELTQIKSELVEINKNNKNLVINFQ